MTTTNNIYSMSDMYVAVAEVLPNLQEVCSICYNFNSDGNGDGNTPSEITTCHVCNSRGWLPTRDLQNIIMKVEYNFTLVLQHDMIGWMADITLDGVSKEWLDNERPVYGDPVTATYAALYRVTNKSSRSPGHTPSKKSLYTNLDASR